MHNEIHPLLVISDHGLPDKNGLELTKCAASLEKVGFPLVILNGVGSEKLAIRTLRPGALDYAVKSNEELRQLPTMANYILREWNLIMQRKHAENELKHFIEAVGEANAQLEGFLDGISKDLDDSISCIHEFCRIMQERYADKLDGAALFELKKVADATEKTTSLCLSMPSSKQWNLS